MKYNCSYYNIVLEETDNWVYIYNSFSGALCKLESEIFYLISNEQLDDENKCKYFDALLEQGLIKPVGLNEYNKIILEEQIAILTKNAKTLSYIIAPTLSCNLDCDYCFEQGLRFNKTMSDRTLIAVADYILKNININTKSITIGWFGGEPLLAYEKILEFSNYIKSKLNEKEIIYSANMITNGVLLDKNKVHVLSKDCNLKRIQITIDGTEEIYCKRKRATRKQFCDLIKNIKDALEYVKVTIRLNCDNDNFQDLKNVAKQIIECCCNHKNLNIYLAKLVDYAECGGEQYYSQLDFDNKKIEFDKYISVIKGEEYKPQLYKYKKTFCGLIRLHNQVIGPDGEIYKCEHHLGQTNKIIGDINSGLYFNNFLMKFIKNEPLEKCKKCKIFPLCLGGCPAQKNDLPESEACLVSENYIKHLMNRFVRKEKENC